MKMTIQHEKERYTVTPDVHEDTSARVIGRLGSVFGLTAAACGACILAIGAITAARSHHVLSELPQWENPIEHMNNVTETLAVDIVAFLGVGSSLLVADRCLTPRGGRAITRSLMVAGVVLNGIAEQPATQPLLEEAHLFTRSTPDDVDFIYGAAASVLLANGFGKVLSARFGTSAPAGGGGDASPNNQEIRVGPADLDLIFEDHQSISVKPGL